MFFKRKALLFLVASVLGLSGCGKFLNEPRQEAQTLEMSNAKFACLQELPQDIADFLRGEIPDSKIRRGFDCAQESLIYFKNKTKGTHGDSYTPEDLRHFFGKYFLKKNNATPEFGRDLFKLKKALLGGSEHSISKDEIQKLVGLLEHLEAQAILVAPHMTTLLGENKYITWEQVDFATSQLEKSIAALLREIDFARAEYRFSDLKKFLEGLEQFIDVEGKFKLTEKLSSNVPLLEAARNVVIGEKNILDSMKDWQIALATSTSLYQQALRYHYFLKGRALDKPAEVQALLRLAQSSVTLFENSLPLQRQGLITFTSMDALLDLLEGRKLLPLGLSSLALKETYKKVILRMLDPQRRGDARGLQGLERVHLAALSHELKIFEVHQRFIDGLPFDKKQSIGFAELQKASGEYSPSQRPGAVALSTDSLEAETLQAAWQEGRQQLLQEFPIFYNQQGRLMVLKATSVYRQSWASLTKWNLMRALSRALLLGYGRGEKRGGLSQEVITVEGMELWYKDFHQIGTELKAFDPRNEEDAGARSFKEANFFTSNGNGDALMSSRETFDFVSLLLAGGVSSAEFIRQDLLANKCGLVETDVFLYPWLQESCVEDHLRRNFATYFNNLPGLVRQVRGMGAEEWREFYGNLMASARSSDPQGGRLETSDLRAAVMILHYTETLMSVYDSNLDGRLNVKELQDAARRFLGFMKEVSPLSQDVLVTEFFLFLVHKGKKPTVREFIYFQGEKAFGGLEDIGRDKILRVFKVLKEEAAKK